MYHSLDFITWGSLRCAMYWFRAVILAVYSEEAALR